MGVDTIGLCSDEPHPAGQVDVGCAVALVAHMPTVAAAYWRLLHGPDADRPAAGPRPRRQLPVHARRAGAASPRRPGRSRPTLNTVVDHGMNASTFTARVITSTRSDIVSAIVGAIGALKGPLHGGAPGPALDMVFEIRRGRPSPGDSLADEADRWVRETMAVRRPHHGLRPSRLQGARPAGRCPGPGGASACSPSPARLACTRMPGWWKQVALRVLEELKPGRNLKTNVEFYTALVLHGIGLEVDMFTPTFAVGRVGGWTAHVLEQVREDRLIRPDAEYVGAMGRAWVPVAKR